MASGDHNGNSFEMGRLWGQLQGHMHHHGEALERQNEILLDMNGTLNELPHKIALAISSQQTSAIHLPSNSLSEAKGILASIPPIFRTAAILLTIIGLLTGGISWSDLKTVISSYAGAGG